MIDEELAPEARMMLESPAFSRVIEIQREYYEDQIADLKANQVEEFTNLKLKSEMLEELVGSIMHLAGADLLTDDEPGESANVH